MKKIISAVLLLCIFLFAASCTDNKKNNDDVADTPSSSAQIEDETLDMFDPANEKSSETAGKSKDSSSEPAENNKTAEGSNSVVNPGKQPDLPNDKNTDTDDASPSDKTQPDIGEDSSPSGKTQPDISTGDASPSDANTDEKTPFSDGNVGVELPIDVFE